MLEFSKKISKNFRRIEHWVTTYNDIIFSMTWASMCRCLRQSIGGWVTKYGLSMPREATALPPHLLRCFMQNPKNPHLFCDINCGHYLLHLQVGINIYLKRRAFLNELRFVKNRRKMTVRFGKQKLIFLFVCFVVVVSQNLGEPLPDRAWFLESTDSAQPVENINFRPTVVEEVHDEEDPPFEIASVEGFWESMQVYAAAWANFFPQGSCEIRGNNKRQMFNERNVQNLELETDYAAAGYTDGCPQGKMWACCIFIRERWCRWFQLSDLKGAPCDRTVCCTPEELNTEACWGQPIVPIPDSIRGLCIPETRQSPDLVPLWEVFGNKSEQW